MKAFQDGDPTVKQLLDEVRLGLDGLESKVEQHAARLKGFWKSQRPCPLPQLDQLLAMVMERLADLLRADAATLFLLDVEKGELWSKVLRGSQLKEIRVKSNAGLVGQALKTGGVLLLADAYDDVRFNPDIDKKSGFRTRSVIAAPLKHPSGRRVGVLEVIDKRVNAFSPDDAALVEGVAAQLATLLDNVQLLQQLTKQNHELTAARDGLASALRDLDLLFEIEKLFSAELPSDSLLDSALALIQASLGAAAGSVVWKDPSQSGLVFRAVRGGRSEALQSMRIRLGQGIVGRVVQTQKALRLARAGDSPFHDRLLAKKLGFPASSVLCVPVAAEGECLGALELLNKPGGFTSPDERLAQLVGGQIGRAMRQRQEKEAAAQRERLQLIGQMLSSVIHDVRTPMSIISGYAQMIAEESDASVRQEYAAQIQSQIDHLNAMTKETLAFARGESTLLWSKVYLQEFVESVSKQLAPEFEAHGMEFRAQAIFSGAVRMDDSKMKRVIHNLARNAIEAMEAGGRFLWTVEQEGREWIMRFSDTGPGIPESISDRVFDGFVTAGKEHGTGLGLAIVKRIVEEHSGTVSVKSKPGKGTQFEVRLPLQSA